MLSSEYVKQASSVLREASASTGHGKGQHRTSRDGNECTAHSLMEYLVYKGELGRMTAVVKRTHPVALERIGQGVRQSR